MFSAKIKKTLVEKLLGRKLPKETLCTSNWKEEERRWASSASKVHSSGYSRHEFNVETSNNPQHEGTKLELYPLLSTERSLFPLTIEIRNPISTKRE